MTRADPKTVFNRFGGEGEGAHTHLPWDWRAGDTFRFFVRKQPGPAAGTTEARYHVYDRRSKRWRHGATITSPNGDGKSQAGVATVGGGGLASFLENFTGKDHDAPKLALYRLWLGNEAGALKCLTQARGDGMWGQLHDAYFLAEGRGEELGGLYRKLREQYGEPVFGRKGRKLDPISDKPFPAKEVKGLEALPQAPKARDR